MCDFTALYPSLVIAYNLCYSTLAGKLDYHSTRKEMRQEGMTTNKIGPFDYAERRTAAVLKHHMKSLSSTVDSKRKDQDRAYVVPTGSIFVSESVVKGVLPQVLDEILSTRAMLKKAAKQYKKLVPNLSPSILRSLEAKQLALKYVANVTYGYTSATFSGRSAMPLLADAIVECGRRTLTNAIELVQKWSRDPQNIWHGAQVIYGESQTLSSRKIVYVCCHTKYCLFSNLSQSSIQHQQRGHRFDFCQTSTSIRSRGLSLWRRILHSCDRIQSTTSLAQT